MNATQDSLHSMAGAALKRYAGARETQPKRWAFEVSNGKVLHGRACLEDGFLQLVIETGKLRAPFDPKQLLAAQQDLPGLVKYGVAPNPWRLEVRAEFPCEEEEGGVETRLARTWLALTHAASRAVHPLGVFAAAPQPSATAPPETGAATTAAELLAERGWMVHPRDHGSFAVDLESPGGFHQAIVTPAAPGLALRAMLLGAGNLADDACTAIPAYLLETNAAFRLVRSYWAANAAQVEAGYEVCWPAAPSAEELHASLSALSVAARTAASAIRFLQQPAAARLYLAVRKPPLNHHEGVDANGNKNN